MVQALARAGEYRDNDTGQHVLRMSHCAGRLAELAGLDAGAVEQIRLAAQLHDLGKIGIPDAVLLKRGRIDDVERAIVRRHPEIGAGILAGFDAPLLALARTVAYTHHERWDGGGYPRGMSGEAIPLAGRIVALCDVFDALLSSRAYKPGWPLARVIQWLNDQAGSHFDPHLTDLLLAHVQEFVQIRADIDAQAPPTYDTGIGPFDGDSDADAMGLRSPSAGGSIGGTLAA
jgi:putative two-component system response regulator